MRPEIQPGAPVRLSVVIPAHNEENYIAPCLEAVLAEVAANGMHGRFEVLVVDNASSDRTAEIARGYQNVRVVEEPTKGLTRARQRGLEEARGSVLAYVDADTRMPPGWIGCVLEAFDRDETLVCVSGPYVYHDATPTEAAFVRLYWRILASPAYRLTGFMVVGGNFAARGEALVRMGGFDTTIAFYGEDTNIARRLAGIGRVCFDGNLVMPTSARRLHAEGPIMTAIRYGANFVSEAVLRRPVTLRYRDVR
jgi:glycosyltransferase involved in cell wall biosynthesis